MNTPFPFLAALSLFTHPLDAAPPQYHVTVLGPGNAYGVNASGQVSGYWGVPGGIVVHAVRWMGNTPTDLGASGGNNSWGYGINASGQVAGRIDNRAVRWTGTTAEYLDSLGPNPNDSDDYGYGINDSGQVAGRITTQVVRWTGTIPTDLNPTSPTYGFGINASGQIAGFSAFHHHAVRLSGETIELLGGLVPEAETDAVAINDSGQVVGASSTFGYFSAVRWTGAIPENLGNLGGHGRALGINASGDVVGMSDTADGDRAPFLYTGGTMFNLNALLLPGSGITKLGIHYEGNCINDRGQIAANGVINGLTGGLLLTPVMPGWPDGDGDGLRDAWELDSWGTMIGHSATDDYDHDGIPELLEEAFGLNPKQPDTLPAAENEGGYLTLTITKHPGVTYEVQTAATPDAPAFSPATTTVQMNDATTLKVRDNILIGTRYLRVKVTAAP